MPKKNYRYKFFKNSSRRKSMSYKCSKGGRNTCSILKPHFRWKSAYLNTGLTTSSATKAVWKSTGVVLLVELQGTPKRAILSTRGLIKIYVSNLHYSCSSRGTLRARNTRACFVCTKNCVCALCMCVCVWKRNGIAATRATTESKSSQSINSWSPNRKALNKRRKRINWPAKAIRFILTRSTGVITFLLVRAS